MASNNANTATSQTLGALTLAGGQNLINAGYTAAPAASATSVLTFASLARSPGATVNFVGGTGNASPLGTTIASGGGYTNEIVLTGGAPTSLFFNGNQGSILPFGEVNGSTSAGTGTGDLATYGTGASTSATNNGAAANFVGITAFSNYATQTVSAGAVTAPNSNGLDIAKLTLSGACTLISGVYGAVLFNINGASTTLTLSGALSVSSGAILTNGSVGATGTEFLITGGSVNLIGETDLFQNIGLFTTFTDTKFTSPITGTGPLVISGLGQIQLASTNTYSGGTIVNSANTIFMDTNAAFGTGPLTLTGGTLTSNTASNTFSNAVNLNGVVLFTSFNTAAAPITFTGPITLTGNSFITAANGNATLGGVFFNGAIGGSGSLNVVAVQGVATGTTAAGANEPVVLNNVNTYTGGTTVAGGILEIGNSNGLGTGGLTLAGGTFEANVSLVLNTPVTLSNATATISSVAVQGQNITFTGATTLTGNNTLTTSSGATTSFSGQISGVGSLSLSSSAAAGGGVFQITNTANNYSGGTTLTNTGTVILSLSSGNVFGSGPLVLLGGNVFATAAITINNNVILNGSTTITGDANAGISTANSVTLAGTVTNFAASTLTANDIAGTTINGVITESNGSESLTLAGTQTVALTSPNAFTGGVILLLGANPTNAVLGTLTLGSSAALGTGTFDVRTGVLNATAALTISNNLIFGNTANNLPVVLTGSNITINGNIVMSGAALGDLSLNNTTTINGIISGAHSFETTNQPLVASTTAGGTTTYTGNGTLILTGANTFGSNALNLNVFGGTVILSGANGAITAANAIVVNTGATLVLDNSGTVNSTRLNAASTITLTGGNLTIKGNGTATLTQTLGALTIGAGNATITSQNNGANVSTTFSSFTRNAGGMVNFTTAGQTFSTTLGTTGVSTGNQILFTTALTGRAVHQ